MKKKGICCFFLLVAKTVNKHVFPEFNQRDKKQKTNIKYSPIEPSPTQSILIVALGGLIRNDELRKLIF
jgi:hypothetical protein